MTVSAVPAASLPSLDEATRRLVLVAAAVAGGDAPAVRSALADARAAGVPAEWVEEAILQSHLFAGFPRALNAMAEWRQVSGRPAADDAEPAPEAPPEPAPEAAGIGAGTCAAVYGASYAALRRNVAALHPALDRWMVAHGYGAVLSRPGLDLARRELCVVAACAVQGQDRQLRAHLQGACNAGAAPETVAAALEALRPLLSPDAAHRCARLWEGVRPGRTPADALPA